MALGMEFVHTWYIKVFCLAIDVTHILQDFSKMFSYGVFPMETFWLSINNNKNSSPSKHLIRGTQENRKHG